MSLGYASSCPGRACDGRHVFAAPTDDPRVFVLMEYAADRFTPTSSRHICKPSH